MRLGDLSESLSELLCRGTGAGRPSWPHMTRHIRILLPAIVPGRVKYRPPVPHISNRQYRIQLIQHRAKALIIENLTDAMHSVRTLLFVSAISKK